MGYGNMYILFHIPFLVSNLNIQFPKNKKNTKQTTNNDDFHSVLCNIPSPD